MESQGQNILTVRGPKVILDEIEESGAFLNSSDKYKHMFGPNNCKTIERTNNCLIMAYPYSEVNMNEYLHSLLKQYKQCWMKNEYENDKGGAGIWIGQYKEKKEVPDIQEVAWTELSIQDIAFGKEFTS